MADNYYKAADKAIKRMDRDNLKAFNKLKMTDFGNTGMVRTVLGLYRKQKRKAKKEYRKIGMEAYIFALWLAEEDVSEAEAEKMAEKAITESWVDDILSETDFVTLYRFNSETERKAQRLLEGLAIVTDTDYTQDAGRATRFTRNDLVDQALKQWVKQLAQYAINVTDYAMMQAYADAGIKEVVWEDAEDGRVCIECHSRNGHRYELEDVPPKPHVNCRCRLRPVVNAEE